jgi:glycosyltransferase involved in cell wall biosynthesis
MDGELVSVIMPVYNAAAWLRRAIESVLTQSHARLELIAVDDGSQDDSHAMLQDIARRDARVRVLSLPANAGVAAARNAGVAAARGDYVAFLDADDWWHADKLQLQLASMRSTGALVSYTAYWRVAEDGRVLSAVMPPARTTWREMLSGNVIGNLTGMYARSLGDLPFQRIGHEDYAFWLAQVKRADGATRVDAPAPLAWYLVHDQSISANKLRAARWQWEIYRKVEKLGLLESSVYLFGYAWRALVKRRGQSW